MWHKFFGEIEEFFLRKGVYLAVNLGKMTFGF